MSLSKRIYETINILQKLPEVQLSAMETVVQIHDPSVCRHVSGLQFREQTLEQFAPKYPFLQARGKIHKEVISDIQVQTHKDNINNPN